MLEMDERLAKSAPPPTTPFLESAHLEHLSSGGPLTVMVTGTASSGKMKNSSCQGAESSLKRCGLGPGCPFSHVA